MAKGESDGDASAVDRAAQLVGGVLQDGDSMGSIVITVPEAWLAMSAPRPSARSSWAMFSRLM